jgi:hypothetical protein
MDLFSYMILFVFLLTFLDLVSRKYIVYFCFAHLGCRNIIYHHLHYHYRQFISKFIFTFSEYLRLAFC